MNALLIVCGLGFVSLLAEIINRKRGLHLMILIGLIGAAIAAAMDWNSPLHYFNDMLNFDRFSVAFTTLIIMMAVFWFGISSPYFIDQEHQTDRTALVIFSMVGGIMMVSFHNMAVLFLGIEILSISLYILAGSNKESFFSNEAAFKYFIMGSFATGFLLMGIALVYGATGSFDITKINGHVSAYKAALPGFFYVGLFMILIGMSFKISAVPFHFWAPDVYTGSPTMITAFMSTVVKTAAVGAFYKVFAQCFLPVQVSVTGSIQAIIVATLLVANITAVNQTNIKRMLAYSSIAHVGYILLGFIAGSSKLEAILFYYLASYATASLVAFGILHAVEQAKNTNADAFAGLYSKNRFAGICMTIALLSLAGIPPLGGFFAKYTILASAVEANYISMVMLAITTSLIGVYYYFKPVIAIFSQVPAQSQSHVHFSFTQRFIIGILTIATLLIGLFPDVVFSIWR